MRGALSSPHNRNVSFSNPGTSPMRMVGSFAGLHYGSAAGRGAF